MSIKKQDISIVTIPTEPVIRFAPLPAGPDDLFWTEYKKLLISGICWQFRLNVYTGIPEQKDGK